MDIIWKRRSVRKFSDRAVEAEKLELLLRAAMQAPSAGNQQPWEFMIVQKPENLETLSHYNPYARCLAGAAVGIVVLGNEKRMTKPEKWEQDLGAATQNLLLEAAHLELGAVWLGTAGDPERMAAVQTMLQLPSHLRPYSVIAVGYPSDQNANHVVDRFDESRIHYFDAN